MNDVRVTDLTRGIRTCFPIVARVSFHSGFTLEGDAEEVIVLVAELLSKVSALNKHLVKPRNCKQSKV